MSEPKKYVVVLAHADGWGASSLNTVIPYLHRKYPDIGIIGIVSQATKNKEGGILTKLDDLKTSRELKEINLLAYFDKVDALAATIDPAENKTTDFTFKKLGEYCLDGQIHFTTRGGLKGGEEVAAVLNTLENERGIVPEVVLSLDTMAILPPEIISRYHCFSNHPGPLDTIRIEGMQGTLRSLVNQVLYDAKGELINPAQMFPMAPTWVKGTFFLQHEELDKGPPVATVLSPAQTGMCAYQVRDELYYALCKEMIKYLPYILDKNTREPLVEIVKMEKEKLDAKPHVKIGELESGQLAVWQGQSIGFPDNEALHGVSVLQNEVVSPIYFKNRMRSYFPGDEQEFEKTYNEIFGSNVDKLMQQYSNRLGGDIWARFYSGEAVTITQYDPATGEPIAVFSNEKSQGRKKS